MFTITQHLVSTYCLQHTVLGANRESNENHRTIYHTSKVVHNCNLIYLGGWDRRIPKSSSF